jgi:fructokinase
MHRIGIDMGGTKIEGIVLDADGAERFRKRIPTEGDKGYARIIENIRTLYTDLSGQIDDAPHTFGIGTPGSLSRRTDLLKGSNTVCMNGKPVRADLERILGRPIAIQNDANCFAEAEAVYGAGKGHGVVFGVIMGTGCGGGLVIDGAVRTGRLGIAGEWGHMSIDPNGPLCYCGQRGCVETYISGGGLQKRWTERTGATARLQEIEAAYRAGDAQAVAFMQDFFRNFGRCMANLINILDPDIIVLGGGVSNMDCIYTDGVRAVAAQVFNDTMDTPIVRHTLGDSAGVIGAALIGVPAA